ncbi:MAG TPA: sigma-70 family RNA polymerase sigma factor [Bryobacteraceae bacterium]|jgi:RNA polymerase sigma-70 factor (ECF subfamily)
MEISDEAAVDLTRRGDPDAYRILVDRHSRAVYRLAWRMTANSHEAEDIVQETFLRAYKQLHRFDGRAAFSTWVHRIAVNCSLDLIRSRKRRQEVALTGPPDEAPGEQGADRLLLNVPSSDPSPERNLQSTQIREILAAAMQELSDMERCAFTMRHHDGLGIEEISRALGVQPNAAKHSIFRALKKLRRTLEPALASAKGVV